MKQFILGGEPDKNGAVRLSGDDYHYLVRVRRLASGEFFPALLPDGRETLVQITSISNNVLTGKCREMKPNIEANKQLDASQQIERQRKCLPPIILFQALPKSDKMDLIVRQAAEGGIAEIVPFVSDFSVVNNNTAKAAFSGGKKILRWERIIKEARQQSGSKTATALRPPVTLNELLKYWQELIITGDQADSALGLLFHHLVLEQKSLHEYLNIIPNIVVLAVGPEGGFSDREVSLFLENGFKPLTIGDTILRTETAALYCSAAIRILLLERNAWELKKEARQ